LARFFAVSDIVEIIPESSVAKSLLFTSVGMADIDGSPRYRIPRFCKRMITSIARMGNEEKTKWNIE
jgi:hypothetical protein